MSELVIADLRVAAGTTEIVKGLSLTIRSGEIAVIMGPNGCGKSTFAQAIAGHPGYRVTGGSVHLDGVDLLALDPAERARAGLFLAMQHPLEVPGVRPRNVFASAGVSPEGLADRITAAAEAVDLRPQLLDRFLNVDLSGGEKKRAEMVQLGILRPAFALLDEIDSGLDVDALAAVAERLRAAQREWQCGVIAITHFRRLVDPLQPDVVHVMTDGRIVASGGRELATQLEAEGYEPFRPR
jgi:Fe-S cluster assembly ATP-binding protein